jgi:transposase-like protein
MEQTLTVATFNEAAPAEVLKDRLLDSGLHADLMDESGAQAIFFMNRDPRAHMRVLVRKEEFDTALKLTGEWEKEGLMSEAVRCPQCGSSRIEYPQFSRRTSGSIFFALLAAAHLIPREYFCEDCQFTWPDKVVPEIERDALNWPPGSNVP